MKPEILWVGNSERAPWRCLRPGAGAQKAGGPPSVMASSSWAWGLGWDGWGQAARKCIALHVLALWVTKHHFHQFYSSRSSQKSAAAAKSLQSSPTLCDPINGSPPGCPVPGILQARTLEWIAISFSNALKWKVKVKSLSCDPMDYSFSKDINPVLWWKEIRWFVDHILKLRTFPFHSPRAPSKLPPELW